MKCRFSLAGIWFYIAESTNVFTLNTTVKCLSIGTPKIIKFPLNFVLQKSKIDNFRCPKIWAHYNYNQSNLDYSKCQGPPDFLRIIGSSNFQSGYFSAMLGSFRSVIILDCISIKNGEQGIISNLWK